MGQSVKFEVKVEAELRVPVATAQIVHFESIEPADNTMRKEDAYRFDLCLTPRPRNTRASYPDRWSPQRFERLGNVFLVPPGETIRARGDVSCRQSSLLFHLAPEPVRKWLDDELEWTDPRLAAGLDIRDNHIRGLLLRLADEARHPGFASEMLVELIAAQLSIELSRYYRAHTPGAGSGLAAWRLRLIEERLREVREAPTLTELAELCRLSVRQLTRGFRASRGCSIGDYVSTSRVEHAKRLLATDESIKSIAYSLGFSTPSSFCFAFRRATGQTPREFRNSTLRRS